MYTKCLAHDIYMHHFFKKKQIVKIITNPLHNICKKRNKWKTEKSIQIQSCKTQ